VSDYVVINPKRLPPRFPFLLTAVAILWLDRYNAPGWVWGVWATVLFVAWIGAGFAVWRCEFRDPFSGGGR